MLEFEFIQPGEFEDPYYNVIHDGDIIAYLYFKKDLWRVNFSDEWWLESGILPDISDMIDKLTESTRAQRILGVF